MRTWLITGRSSGIGKIILEMDDYKIVTARNKNKVMDIVEVYPVTA